MFLSLLMTATQHIVIDHLWLHEVPMATTEACSKFNTSAVAVYGHDYVIGCKFLIMRLLPSAPYLHTCCVQLTFDEGC